MAGLPACLLSLTIILLCRCALSSPVNPEQLQHRTMFRDDIPEKRPLSGNYLAQYAGFEHPRSRKHSRSQKQQQEVTFTNDYRFEYTGSDSGRIYEYPTKFQPYVTPKPKVKSSDYSLKPNEDGIALQFEVISEPGTGNRRDDRGKVSALGEKPQKVSQGGQQQQQHYNPYAAAYGHLPHRIRNMWKDWVSKLSSVRRSGNGQHGSLLSAIPVRLSGLSSQISKSGQAHVGGSVVNRISKPIGYKVAFQPSLAE